MKIILGLVLAISVGCAGNARPSTTPTCPSWICGQNGTQTTGVAGEAPTVVETVTLPSGEVVAPK